MKTPKALYASARMIYHPELSSCPLCGGPIALANYLLWDKTIQTVDTVLSVASRPGACAEPSCPAASMRLRSAAGQRIALPHSTYGLDVLVRIGWLRHWRRSTFREIHAELPTHLQISEAHIRHLYQQSYLPLLACHEQQQQHLLAQAAQQYGGLVLALDGLAPEGGEPQLWCVRELLTGLVLRSGWLARQDQASFEAWLQPLRTLPWPIRALVSDKQRGLLPAITTVFPTTLHQFCHGHYLRNLAEPLAAVDSALAVTVRKAVRQNLGSLLLAEPSSDPSVPALLTSTGLLSPALPVHATDHAALQAVDCAAAPLTEPLVAAQTAGTDSSCSADAVVTALLRRTRYLLTLKGRPPLRLAGLEVVAGLQQVAQVSASLLAHRHDQRLSSLAQGLEQALEQVAPSLPDLQEGARWLNDITRVLTPSSAPGRSGEQVAVQLQTFLTQLEQQDSTPQLQTFRRHVQKVSRSYWPGLFHCYDHATIPRTNNAMESHFRDTQRRLLRTSGQQGQSRRTLHRLGAWELLPAPESEAAGLAAFGQIAPAALAAEQQRLRQHQERFRLHTRSHRQTTIQLERLQQQWLALPGTSTG